MFRVELKILKTPRPTTLHAISAQSIVWQTVLVLGTEPLSRFFALPSLTNQPTHARAKRTGIPKLKTNFTFGDLRKTRWDRAKGEINWKFNLCGGIFLNVYLHWERSVRRSALVRCRFRPKYYSRPWRHKMRTTYVRCLVPGIFLIHCSLRFRGSAGSLSDFFSLRIHQSHLNLLNLSKWNFPRRKLLISNLFWTTLNPLPSRRNFPRHRCVFSCVCGNVGLSFPGIVFDCAE